MIGGGIDVVHAATMVMWAATDRRHRRPALANAAVALAFACAEVRSAAPSRGGRPQMSATWHRRGSPAAAAKRSRATANWSRSVTGIRRSTRLMALRRCL